MENVLGGAPQRGMNTKRDDLKSYIEKFMNDYNVYGRFPDSDSVDDNIYEGTRVSVNINKYKRSSMARCKCIEYHGCICNICEMDFEKMYGEIGREFIHAHHIRPISEINSEYIVNYKEDLIPVCSNYHAMLDRKINNRNMSINKLRELIKNSKLILEVNYIFSKYNGCKLYKILK